MKKEKQKGQLYKGGELHKGQLKILRKMMKKPNKFNVILSARQSGKTFFLVQMVLENAINKTCQILIMSPYNAQNTKIYSELERAIEDSGVVKSSNKSEKVMVLINNSVITFKSAENPTNVRGGSYDYIYLDEFAYFKQAAWSAMAPTMAAKKRGQIFIFSTPRGKNMFYDMVLHARSKKEKDRLYSFYFMNYLDNPMYDTQFVEDCRTHWPKAQFDQEFLCKFIDAASVFEYHNSATLKQFQDPEIGEKYYGGLDLARKNDRTVLTIINSKGEVVFIYAINKVNWDTIVSDVVGHLKRYNATCTIEVNNIGDVIFELIKKEYKNIIPITTTNSNKQEYVENLIYAFNSDKIKIPDFKLSEELHEELDTFEMTFSPKTRSVVYAARSGFHDDYIISLCLAYKSYKDKKQSGKYMMYINGKIIT